MAYERHTWECGEEITADKLNHMENGIAQSGGGGTDTLVLRVDRVEGNITYYDHTWQEVHDALENGQRCVVVTENTVTYIDEDTGETIVESQTDVSELVSIKRVSETGGDTYTASAITGEIYNADGANSALYLKMGH